MSVTAVITAVTRAIPYALAGVGVLGYGVQKFRGAYKKRDAAQEEQAARKAEQAREKVRQAGELGRKQGAAVAARGAVQTACQGVSGSLAGLTDTLAVAKLGVTAEEQSYRNQLIIFRVLQGLVRTMSENSSLNTTVQDILNIMAGYSRKFAGSPQILQVLQTVDQAVQQAPPPAGGITVGFVKGAIATSVRQASMQVWTQIDQAGRQAVAAADLLAQAQGGAARSIIAEVQLTAQTLISRIEKLPLHESNKEILRQIRAIYKDAEEIWKYSQSALENAKQAFASLHQEMTNPQMSFKEVESTAKRGFDKINEYFRQIDMLENALQKLHQVGRQAGLRPVNEMSDVKMAPRLTGLAGDRQSGIAVGQGEESPRVPLELPQGYLTLSDARKQLIERAEDMILLPFFLTPKSMLVRKMCEILVSQDPTIVRNLAKGRYNLRMLQMALVQYAKEVDVEDVVKEAFKGKDVNRDTASVIDQLLKNLHTALALRENALNLATVAPKLGKRTADGFRVYDIDVDNHSFTQRGISDIGYEGVNKMEKEDVELSLAQLVQFEQKLKEQEKADELNLEIWLGPNELPRLREEIENVKKQLKEREELLTKIDLYNQSRDLRRLISGLGQLQHNGQLGNTAANYHYAGIDQIAYGMIAAVRARVEKLRKELDPASQQLKEPQDFNMLYLDVVERDLKRREADLREMAAGLPERIHAFKERVESRLSTSQERQELYDAIVRDVEMAGELFPIKDRQAFDNGLKALMRNEWTDADAKGFDLALKKKNRYSVIDLFEDGVSFAVGGILSTGALAFSEASAVAGIAASRLSLPVFVAGGVGVALLRRGINALS